MDSCPKCKSSWIGDPIPDDIKHHYGTSTHWKREIGIDGGYIGIYDGTVATQCPDCESVFPRNGSKWALDLFNKYQEWLKNETK